MRACISIEEARHSPQFFIITKSAVPLLLQHSCFALLLLEIRIGLLADIGVIHLEGVNAEQLVSDESCDFG
jgi:hypothetical protein